MSGSKYLILQHGGSVGLQEYNMGEDLQLETCHKSLSWGWKNKKKNVIPFFALNLSMRKNFRPNTLGKSIFICLSGTNIFSVGICCYPLTRLEGFKKINSIKSLVNNLSFDIGKNVVVRYIKKNENRFGWKFQEETYNKKIEYDYSETPFNKILSKGKLFIHDSNGTGFLETVFYNLPTIVLLDKRCETFRKSSKKLIKLLEKKKIIHYNANSAANFINMNYNNIDKWWFGKDLQSIRKKFCLQYVRQSKSPSTELKNILNNVKKN